MSKKLERYYSLDAIESTDSHYNIIIGKRANGKTQAVLMRILRRWIDHGEKGVYLRRMGDDIKPQEARMVFQSISDEMGLVEKWTNGEWTDVVYYSRGFYLALYDPELGKMVRQNEPFCMLMALNLAERYKSSSGYHDVTTIFFEEFIATGERYLNNEFVTFSNILSTVIRNRNNVKVYLVGNPIGVTNPYLREMGIKKTVLEMTENRGVIDQYEMKDRTGGSEVLRIAVESCPDVINDDSTVNSNVYFAFENEKLGMITTGTLELNNYPHVPCELHKDDKVFFFIIDYEDTLIQGDLYNISGKRPFIYFHERSKHYGIPRNTLNYSLLKKPGVYNEVNITGNNRNRMTQVVSQMIVNDDVYFQDNQIGSLVSAYVINSSNKSLI